jgi:hypothetical protein
MKLVFVITFFLCVPSWAQAEGLDQPSAQELFDRPARELGVPKSLALAIGWVESRLKPWTLNIEGQSLWFDSKEKALAEATEALEAGRSFDVGLMQVNSQWLRRYDIPLEAALDPVANVYFGGWILKKEIERFGGDLRAAVGAYHSPTKARAEHYADMVKAALERGPQRAPRQTAGPAKPKEQDIVAKQLRQGLAGHKMLVLAEGRMSPSGSEMVIQSPRAGLAVPDSMKAAATRPADSMKVSARK